jgi:hypothetical protein
MTFYPKDSHNTDVADGAIRWDGAAFEGRVGGAWAPLGGGGSSKTISRQAASYDVLVGDANGTVFEMSAGATPTTLKLEAAPADNRNLTVVNFGSGVVTVDRNTNNINGVAEDQYLGQYDSIELIYNATDKWLII